MTITITSNEKNILTAIIHCEYQNSDFGRDTIDNAIELESMKQDTNIKGKTLSGVISSLVKKGLAEVQDELFDLAATAAEG